MKSVIEVFGHTSVKIKMLAKEVAMQTIKYMKQPDILEVAIFFVSENKIQRLNKDYRGIDKITDVLSFPSTTLKAGDVFDIDSNEANMLLVENGNIHFGDMAICIKRAREQAKEFGVTIESEIKKLVIHSMLHLMGYDHISDEDYSIMNVKECELSRIIKV